MKIAPLLIFCCLLATVLGNRREKRFLIVPPTAPTRHQWIAGIGIPLDLENIAVTTGYVMKAQYFLPTTVDHLFPLNTWEDIERPVGRKERSVATEEVVLVDNSTGTKYSQYNVPALVIEEGRNGNDTGRGFADSEDDADEFDLWNNDDQIEKDSKSAQNYWNGLHDPETDESSANSRWDAYKLLEGVTNSRGLGGKHCVLRTICESAASPISHKSGILGELLHVLLTPSSSEDKVSTQEHGEYAEAEKLGKDGGAEACEEQYSDCQKSLMDVFTSFENPFESLFNTYL